jgi:folate-dependent tRNA-U54 methylase TrmFO/GidA
LRVPPRTTAIGALAFYVSHANAHDYQPTNITFGIMEAPAEQMRDKQKRKLAISERALADLEEFRRRDAETQSLYFETRSLRLGGSASSHETGR